MLADDIAQRVLLSDFSKTMANPFDVCFLRLRFQHSGIQVDKSPVLSFLFSD